MDGGVPVVLLHGLARTRGSMARLARRLDVAGHPTLNLGYPSRRARVRDCAAGLAPRVDAFRLAHGGRVAFVTHSMGGLVARHLAAGLGDGAAAIAMLCPPNRGSEMADLLVRHAVARAFYGPALHDLVTVGAPDLPMPGCPVLVVAGTRARMPLTSRVVPGPHDGLVSVARAGIGRGERLVALPADHTFIMDAPAVTAAVIAFLAEAGPRTVLAA